MVRDLLHMPLIAVKRLLKQYFKAKMEMLDYVNDSQWALYEGVL